MNLNFFLKEIVDKKKDIVKFQMILQTNERYVSVIYVYVRFVDSYWFLSIGLDDLVKTIDSEDLENLKRNFRDKREYLNKKSAYPYE